MADWTTFSLGHTLSIDYGALTISGQAATFTYSNLLVLGCVTAGDTCLYTVTAADTCLYTVTASDMRCT